MLARMRRSPSPISAMSSVRMAAAIADVASTAAARAGATASTHATPTTANVMLGSWYAWITNAAPIPAAPDDASTMTLRGLLPNRPNSGAAMAATTNAMTRSRIVVAFAAAMIGMIR